MRLLLFNLRMDADDTTLGFTTAWVNAIAARCEHVDVVTMHRGVVAAAPNVSVYSVGRDEGLSRPRRLARFYRLTWQLTSRAAYDGAFAHMTQLFAVLFWPIARIRGIPILLWYAHGSLPWDVKVAHRLVDRCVTSTPSGLRIRSPKVRVLHQGIDTTRFQPAETPPPERATSVVSIGRLSPKKNLLEVIDAFAAAGREELRLAIFGEPAGPGDEAYASALEQRIRDLGLEDRARLAGPVPFTDIDAEYRRAGFFLNLSDTGSLDKAILEAMASGSIPISRNESFVALAREQGLELLVPGPGPAGAGEALARVSVMPAPEQEALRARLREIVQRDHSLSSLADAIVDELQRLAGRRPR